MQARDRWLTPVGAAIVGLVVVANGAGQTGFGVSGAPLLLTLATAGYHINHIFAKTAVRDRAQAVVYAYRKGLASES